MAWQTLVTAEQVADQLGDPRLLVFDCRYELARAEAGREAYLRGHLPGAVHADLHHDLAGPTTPTSGRARTDAGTCRIHDCMDERHAGLYRGKQRRVR